MYRAIKYALPPGRVGAFLGRATFDRVHLVVARQRVRHRRDDPRLRAVLIEPVRFHHVLHGDPDRSLRGPGHPGAPDDVHALPAPRASRGLGRHDPRIRGRQHHECVLGLWRVGAGRRRDGPGDRGRSARNCMEARNGNARNGRSRGGIPSVHFVRSNGPLRVRVLSVLRDTATRRESSDADASAAAMSITKIDTTRAR